VKSVKTNGGIVILKNGKVSCSCCEGGGDCCMYPYEFYQSLFDFEDLPDQLILGGEIYEKLPEPLEVPIGFTAIWQGGDVDELQGSPDYGKKFIGTGGSIANEWYLGVAGTLDGDHAPCLGSSIDQQIFYDLTDFEDTYTVTTYESFTVSRRSLCQWVGFDSNGCIATLQYLGVPRDLAQSEFAYKWFLDWSPVFDPIQEGCGGSNEGGPKIEGFQNTPVGIYQDPISQGLIVTVSE
jgi:hypothetical protein